MTENNARATTNHSPQMPLLRILRVFRWEIDLANGSSLGARLSSLSDRTNLRRDYWSFAPRYRYCHGLNIHFYIFRNNGKLCTSILL